MKQAFRIALAGNPNCGKTCIFNALTAARQHVGNYPGVTVESKSGRFFIGDKTIELIDLPGVYSLSSSSPEEDVVFQELTQPGIDLILNVVDSTIPQRSLYLTTQLAELHIPMMLIFNMSDDAKLKGLKYDIPKLETYFGSPVIQTVATKSNGLEPLLSRLETYLDQLDSHGVPMLSYGADFDDAINAVAQKVEALNIERFKHIPARFFAIKLLEHDTSVMRIKEMVPAWSEVDEQIKHLREKHDIEADTFMADRRYAMLAGACRDAISSTPAKRREISDKIDTVLTNKVFGFPLFLVIMYLTFWFTFICAEPLMGYIENFFEWLSATIGNCWQPDSLPVLRSIVIDAMIGGVGGVIVFLPNILFLFFAIAILEESGYMSRAAFIMDGVMRKFGLQGRSFVPLVLGFGCTVPAIMATRCIESNRDRTVTIMVLPLMSCSARLPIYALIIPAFFAPKYQPLMMWLIYIIGVATALLAARIMKSTIFKGDGEVYLMELPPYRMPTIKSLLFHMWDRGWMYLQKAGTLILAASILLYICNTYPEKKVFSQDYDAQIAKVKQTYALTDAQLEQLANCSLFNKHIMKTIRAERTIPSSFLATIENTVHESCAVAVEQAKKYNDAVLSLKNAKFSESFEYTISGRLGTALTPLFRHIGFDAKLTTASIGALAAKEIFVSQLGILYKEGSVDESSEPLREHLKHNYTPLQAFCIMLFCLLSIPCLATLAVIKRELNSWKMAGVEAVSLFLLAYTTTAIVFNVGRLFGL